MKKIFLKKDIVTGHLLTQDGVLAYIALKIIIDESLPLYNKTSTMDCVSVNRMAYALIGSQKKYDRVFLASLQRGIYELQFANTIKIFQDFSTKMSNEYIVDFSNMYLNTKEEQFVIIFLEELHRILTCNEIMKKKISMLKYFVAVISTFNWSKNMRKLQGRIGTMSIDYIASQADISSRTCIRYNEILSKMKILYIYKSNDKVRHGNKLRQIKNCYSRYTDKESCEEYGSNYENWYGVQHKIVLTQKNKEQADNNRRLAAIYNRICEGYGNTYDEDTVREVHRYVVNKNRVIQKEINAKYKQKYLTDSDKRWVNKLKGQLRDEILFEQFDFLISSSNQESDNWREPDSMEQDFSIEEILDMPTEGDVNNGNNEQNIDKKSHGEDNHGIFCVTGNDSGLVDIDDLY